MTASERRLLAVVLAGAFVLRVAVAAAWHAPLTGDAADYHRLAEGLAAGRGYVDTNGAPTAWRPPGYALLLAAVYRTGGEGPLAIGLVQAVVGTGSVAAAFAVASATFGVPAGLVAAALVAVDAAQLALTGRRLSEGLATLLLLLLVLTSIRTRERLRSGGLPWLGAAVAGALGGILTLTRGLFVAYPPALALALLLDARPTDGTRRWRPVVTAVLVLLVSFALTLVPWTLRNISAVGAPVPVATQGGITLYASWFPPEGTIFGIFPDDEVTRSAGGLSELDQSRHFVRATVRGLEADPAAIPRLLVLKMAYLLVPLDWEVLPFYGAVNPTYLLVALWAGAFLLVLGAGRRGFAWPVWLPVAYVTGMALVFYGSPRLRAPVEPLLAALAAAAVVALARRRGARTAMTAFAATGAAAALTAVLAVPLKATALAVLRAVGLWRR